MEKALTLLPGELLACDICDADVYIVDARVRGKSGDQAAIEGVNNDSLKVRSGLLIYLRYVIC